MMEKKIGIGLASFIVSLFAVAGVFGAVSINELIERRSVSQEDAIIAGGIPSPEETIEWDYTTPGGRESMIPSYIETPGQALELLQRILSFAWIVLMVIVVIMLLYGGFKFVTASEDGNEIEKARIMMKFSLIGIMLMILAGGAVVLIMNIVSGGIGS